MSEQVKENVFANDIGEKVEVMTARLIKGFAEYANENGIDDRKNAFEIAAQAVLGSAALVRQSGEHPWELVDRVCSPGGTTIEGLLTLQKEGFDSAIIKTIE